MLISIIVVNYNTGLKLKESLDSLYEMEDSTKFELIIVDNNSSDESRRIIEEYDGRYDNIKTLFFSEDKGFAYANNRGYEICAGKFILIMNPDIILKMPVLNKLVEELTKDENIGAISPALIGSDGKFQRNYFIRYPSLMQFILFHSVLCVLTGKYPGLMNQFQNDGDIQIKYKRLEVVKSLPFVFFLTTREKYEEVGKIDENYKLFFEDIDMSYNLHKKYNLALDSSARVTHLGGSSMRTNENWRLLGRYLMSMNYFFDKNYTILHSSLLKFLCVNNSVTVLVIEFFKSLFKKNNKYREDQHKYFLKEFIQYYF